MAYPNSNKIKNRLNLDGTLFFFFSLPWVDAPHDYMGAWALGCFYSHIGTRNLSEGADRVAGQLPLQWCHQIWQSLEEGAGKRCSECGTVPTRFVSYRIQTCSVCPIHSQPMTQPCLNCPRVDGWVFLWQHIV